MFGQNLKRIRQEKGISINGLSRKSGVNASYISAIERDEKKNPSYEILTKISDALEINLNDLFDFASNDPNFDPDAVVREHNIDVYSYTDIDNGLENSSINTDPEEAHKFIKESQRNQFTSDEEAMKFILSQQVIMGRGGFDIDKLSESQIIDFANELLNQLELLGFKYSKQK